MNNIHYGRKRKNIIVALNRKIDDFLKSIGDKEIGQILSDNIIVTGGSIASMFMGERINDYDIYFRTKYAALIAANYFVNKFAELNPETFNVPFVIEEEDRVKIRIQSSGIASESGIVSEMFAEDKEEFEVDDDSESLTKPETKRPKYRPVFISANAITLSDGIQIIIRFFGNYEEIHKSFDFEHAKGCFDYSNQKLIVSNNTLECYLSRTLVYGGSLYPIASIFRAKKFIQRGWRISAGELLKIMWQISELDLTDFDVLEEQLTGVDMAYMWQLIAALKSVDKDKINSTYVAAIIDRIFQ